MNEQTSAQLSPLAGVKHTFFALRNGIVADALREAGLPDRMIFGLQLPQLSGIARDIGKDASLARLLWADSDVRESRLLACWVMPVESISEEDALEMGRSLRSREEADILAFRLLRYHPEAENIEARLQQEEGELPRYLATALHRNLEAMK